MSDPAPSKIILYGHAACPGVGPVKGLLKQAEVPFDYIDIYRDRPAAARVRAINDGNESVPTLEFPDGTTLAEPSVGQLTAKLETMGYQIGVLAWLIGNVWRIVIVIGVGLALLRAFGVF